MAFQLLTRYPPMMRRFPAVAAAALLLSGCANNFARFYNDSPVGHNVTLLPYSGKTQVYSSSDLKGDGLKLRQCATNLIIGTFKRVIG